MLDAQSNRAAKSGSLTEDLTGVRDPAPELTTDAILSNQARRAPRAPALKFGDLVWTYADLEGRANALAARFAAAGARPGDLIGLYLDRSPDMVAAMWAAWKIGCAYLPLDPSFPANRLNLVIADARPTVLATQRTLEERRPAADAQVVICDGDDDIPPLKDRQSPPRDPQSLAYVLYTSGSTGKPKGVEIRHGSVTNLLDSMRARLGFTTADSLLAVTTISFDISVLELFLPLTTGACALLAPAEAAADPQALARLLDASPATFMQATPAGWRYLIEAGWNGKPGLTALCGGEAMSRDLADRLLTRADMVWNLYGPTETTVWSTMHRVRSGAGAIPIGEPIDRTGLHILDEAGLPTDGVGELHISGAGLARGYRNRPDLTAERFVHRDGLPGARLYRTGDLVRRGVDGEIEFLGRSDDQVKIRGFRIELGDIEAALAAHPDVAWAAVQTWPDQTGEKMLAAYVVPRGDAPVDAVALRDFVRGRLPAYMAPSRIVPMTALPMTPNGKVDRKALPAPDTAPPLPAATASGDLTDPTEIRLAAIWSELLNVGDIGPEDNFFDLGGYSLMAVTLILRIEEEFARTLSIGDIFVAGDLRAMAALLSESASEDELRPVPLQPKGSRPPLYWFEPGPSLRGVIEQMDRDQPVFGLGLSLAEARQLVQGRPTVRDLAAPLLRRLRAAPPAAVYSLAGAGPWGLIALEAAQQLAAEGGQAPLVVLIDTPAPPPPAEPRSFGAWLRDLFARDPDAPAAPEAAEDDIGAAMAVAVDRAAAQHRIGSPYPGPVVLIRSPAPKAPAAETAWSHAVAGRLVVDDLPTFVTGRQGPMETAQLAERLSQRLAEGLVQPT